MTATRFTYRKTTTNSATGRIVRTTGFGGLHLPQEQPGEEQTPPSTQPV